ncbi:MAG: peroxiredoxin, OsmC subfamily [Myxococcales bacterium]|nr:peroxiredoxin, OsmC subfamily [Myxococcales bacterium]
MALKRSSNVVWHGTGPKGSGAITTLSGALKDQPYSVNSRFQSEDGRAGTNPEELIAAAHASCFTMALAFALTNAGHEPKELRTSAVVSMDKQDIGWTITQIDLDVKGSVPNVTPEQFQTIAETAKKNCPISRALGGVSTITLSAQLA